MPIVTLTSGAKFNGLIGSSLLEAAAKGGVFFPYSCKNGRCSACKCKLLIGQTRKLHPESGLTEEEKTNGWILGCARSAESDITLEVDDLGSTLLPTVKTLPCRISQLNFLAPDVIQVMLRLPPTADFNFIPGQYIDVIGQNGIRRSYSLANADFTDRILELHIRAVEGGAMSEYWFNQAKVNDLLRLNGPLGTFFLRNTGNIDLIFLATGTGIAPVKAMLESLHARPADQRPRSVTVLWGGRITTDLYFNISSIAADFDFIPVLSRANKIWSGAQGYVQNALLAVRTDLKHAAVYACGSDVMIQNAKKILLENGLPEKCFYSDAFVCSS